MKNFLQLEATKTKNLKITQFPAQNNHIAVLQPIVGINVIFIEQAIIHKISVISQCSIGFNNFLLFSILWENQINFISLLEKECDSADIDRNFWE